MNNSLKYVDFTGHNSEIVLDCQLDLVGLNQSYEVTLDSGNFEFELFKIFNNPLNWDTLKQGSKGPQVEQLQRVLNYLGYPTKIDGDFGPSTRRSVEAFQGKNGLSVDGTIGKNGRFELAKALGITEKVMELVEVNVDQQSNELYPLMQPEAAEEFQGFLQDVRADESIPMFSFGEVFRPRKKQAHFKAISNAKDTVDLDKHQIAGKVNSPGMSFHEVGLAFDANISSFIQKDQQAVEKIANQHGFYRTVSGEKWHFGYVGTNPPSGLILQEKVLRDYIATSLGYYSWDTMYNQAQFLFQQSGYDDYVCPFGNNNYGE